MGLTAAEAGILNKMLEKHVLRQRRWPRLRYVVLVCGAVLFAMGLALWMYLPALDVFLMESKVPTVVTAHTDEVATQPVTHRQLWVFLEARDRKSEDFAKFAAVIASARLFVTILASFFVFVGAYMVVHTLVRWNQHRRDILLIELLREKCRAELGGK